ncbi:alpha/beta fold hydrolase [Aquisalinus flavus]|uniref:Hydrolase n=1 Tax=Aquisalinus flavus TaxID=1526572 RepID=A0A8J2Y6Q7_9PROT|nr:alpha/beta hydrolase [Aquisalinus flavus]MBD0426631.1 alpha/beta hydrolase [Aquisalinus flavus]GGD06327.1 hydrolase [Aquisalinus flavus]
MSIDDPTRVFAPADLDYPPVVPVEPKRHVCPVNGLELSYLVWGDAAKPPIVLVHGGKDHGRMWDWTVADMIDEWCVIVPDLRGHGDSGRAPGGGYEGEYFISDFAGLMAHLEREGFALPMPLIGHSLGGNIVLNYAAIYPDKVTRLIALEGLGASEKHYTEFMEKSPAERYRSWIDRRLKQDAIDQRRFDSPEEMVSRMAGVHKNLDETQARHLALHAARHYPDAMGGGWGWKHDPLTGIWPSPRMTAPAEYSRIYAEITCPVLLMRGEDSWASDPEKDGRIEAFRDARLINYDKAGHWLHHDRFDAFIRDVKTFLAQ